MSLIQFCGKQWFNKVTIVYFERFVRVTNCFMCTAVVIIMQITCPTATQDVQY